MSDLIVWLFFGSLIGMIVIYAWPVLLAFLVLAGVGKLIGYMLESREIDRKFRHDNRSALMARADRQHRQVMSGDVVSGTYGDYLPPPGLR